MTAAVVRDETAAVLALVRRARLRDRGALAYRIYVVLLVAAIGVPTVGAGVRDALAAGVPPGRAAVLVPFAVAATALMALWGSAREGLLRGPVSVEAPVIDWVLPSPVRWESVLGGAFTRGVAVRAAVGTVLCLLLLFLLWRTVLPLPGAPGLALAQSAAAGALLGALSAGLRALGSAGIRRWWYAALLAAFGGAAALAWKGVPESGLLLWSGPWGWAAQAITGARSAWPALALLAAVTCAVLAAAARRLPRLTFGELRRGAEVTAALRSGHWMIDPGWAAGAAEAAKAELSGSAGRAVSARIPLPTRALPAVAWRDLVGILRDSDALLRAAVLVVVALLAGQIGGTAGVLASCAGLSLAVGALLGGARACASAPDRARYLPLPPRVLALAFGATPLAVAAVLTAIAAAVLAALGADPAGLLGVAVLLPAAVAAGLVGAYRGFLPTALLTGMETPFGSTAPLQIAVWHGAGPLALATVAVGAANPLWLAAGTAATALWAAHRGVRALGGG